jgi:hypothetical protein
MTEVNSLTQSKRVKVIRVKGMRDDGVEIGLHFFLTYTLDGQYLTPRPDHLFSGGKNPG